LKVHRHIRSIFPTFLLVVAFAAVLVPSDTPAQGFPAWWGSTSWFDWSDFRMDIGGRVMIPKMTLGKFEGASIDPTSQRLVDPRQLGRDEGGIEFRGDLGMDEDPDTFKSLQATFYIDRLGLRICYDAGMIFTGRKDLEWTKTSPTAPMRVVLSAFDAESPRVGLDLDIIRYPFLRVGLDFDVHTSRVRFARKYWDKLNQNYQVNYNPVWSTNLSTPPQFPPVNWLANFWDTDTVPGAMIPKFVEHAYSLQPITIGFHATAIPGRVRDVPVLLQARCRFPVPFLSQISVLNREYEARIIDIELSGGLRPSVWETSLFGHTTFSVGIQAGYRWQYLEGHMVGHVHEYDTSTNPWPTLIRWDKFDFNVKAAWQGAFFQLKGAF